MVRDQLSAPLAARYAALLAKYVGDVDPLRKQILAATDDDRLLPVSTTPAELEFYNQTRITQFRSASV